jgi:hypothetical protein
MKQIQIDINCGDTLCGWCDHFNGNGKGKFECLVMPKKKNFFGLRRRQVLKETKNREPIRLPECLAAEVKGKALT